MSWGAGLLGGGLVLLVVARFLKSAPLAADKPTPQAKPTTPRMQPAPVTTPAKSAAPAVPASPPATGAPKPGIDPEDAEIEALLRKRGIM